MLNKLLLACAFLLIPACHIFSADGGAQAPWLTNYEQAINQGKASGKTLVLFFTGSDWCSWCSKLEEEVFNTKDFQDATQGKFIFVKLDFPLYSPQDPQLKLQNKQLQQKLDVRSYPTVILWDASRGQKVGVTGYRPGGGRQYAAFLLKMLNEYTSYKQKVSALNEGLEEGKALSGVDLKQLYEKAKELNSEEDANKLISYGMDSDQSFFFGMERYQFLANEGQIHKTEAQAIRHQLLSDDPNNDKLAHYQVAVIEFQAFCEEIQKENYAPELAVAPLISYIEKFGSKDKDNLWRLQMIISQVYLEKNEMSRALKHAQESYKAAPPSVQPEIARTIQNIQSQLHSSLSLKLPGKK